MEITFRNTLSDLVRFNLYHASRRVITWLIILAIVLLVGSTIPHDYSLAAQFFVFVVVALFGTLGYFVATALFALVSYSPSKNRGVIGEHKVAISPDGLMEETDVSSGTWSWASVPKLSRNRRYIFIYVQENAAHIIPIRAFPSRAEADSFFEAATSMRTDARARAV